MTGRSSTPTISVCIPVYNGEQFIGQAIDSVLQQTFGDFELVIVDNLSSDGTVSIVKAYGDPRIRFFQNDKNLGMQGNFNRCLAEARGKYIKFLCADDVFYPSLLASQVKVFEDPGNEDVVLVSCTRDIIDQFNRKLMKRKFSNQVEKTDGVQLIRLVAKSGVNLIGEPSAVMFRSKSIEKCGVFDPKLVWSLDIDLWCRILETGKFYYLPEVLCAFRVARSSHSVQLGMAQIKQHFAFIDALGKRMKFNLSIFDRYGMKMLTLRNVILRRAFYLLLDLTRPLRQLNVRRQ